MFVQDRRPWTYGASIATFTACLLTHESAATLLPMMIVLEGLLVLEGRPGQERLSHLAARYLPFALLLAAFLVVAYVVNSRSYLVREGYYAFGAHAVTNAFNYLVALYVGRRSVVDYALIAAVAAAVLLRGTLRMRFFLAWIVITMLPVLFFTWGIASRYLYVPAAGFALLLAETFRVCEGLAARRLPPRLVRTAIAIVAVVLAVRFGIFAQKGAEGFRARTQPSERLAAALIAANPTLPRDRVVYIDAETAEGVLASYRAALAEEAFCTSGVRVVVH
jgi:hypothetical protein